MKKKINILIVSLSILSMLVPGCTTVGILAPEPTTTPTSAPTATLPPPTSTPTVTPTSPPTPTPIPQARIESADQALFNGDWDTALTEYQQAFSSSTDPEVQAAALLGIGKIHNYQKDYSHALDDMRGLIESYPDSPLVADAYFFLAEAYFELTRYLDAAEAYQSYMARRPGLIDGYVLEWRGDALYYAGDYAGAINDYQSALTVSREENVLQLQIKLARTTAIVGDYNTAIVMYTDIYSRSDSAYTKAQMDYLLGQAYTALGQTDQANAAYLDAIANYPVAGDAYQSLVVLVNGGYPVDELSRGLVDYFAQEYNVAVAAFDRYLASNPTDPATAYYYKGLALVDLGDASSAIAQWDIVINTYPESSLWDDAHEQKAYISWAYLDLFDEGAQTLLDYVDSAPYQTRAAEFLYDAGRIYERGENLLLAAQTWERLADDYATSEYAFQGLFLAGIAYYRLGDYLNAEAVFGRLSGTADNISERAQAEFWVAKSISAQGRASEATAAWEKTASIDPTGYYSERARDIVSGREPFTPPSAFDLGIDYEAERQEAENWLRRTFNLPDGVHLQGVGQLANDPRFTRGTELWRLGLYSRARDEFESLRLYYENDPENTYRLANHYSEIGLYRSSILAARRVLALAGMDDAATVNAPDHFNHLRFATYYSDLVFEAGQESDIHPLLLFSIIRQESFFEPFAFSPAAASGLMQFIASTGQERANMLNWPPNYTQQDLLRPVVSITFGADYLASLKSYLDEDIFAALAAYNGGPGNSNAWKTLSNGDQDLFLEIIRFQETHNYITTIYEVFTIYRRLYGRGT